MFFLWWRFVNVFMMFTEWQETNRNSKYSTEVTSLRMASRWKNIYIQLKWRRFSTTQPIRTKGGWSDMGRWWNPTKQVHINHFLQLFLIKIKIRMINKLLPIFLNANNCWIQLLERDWFSVFLAFVIVNYGFGQKNQSGDKFLDFWASLFYCAAANYFILQISFQTMCLLGLFLNLNFSEHHIVFV